ncbi:porin family protein [Pontibacter lucknowensis]|uniref:Outer membrane protein beta-barrel domain-containing protein n=1 Tax=Pontibacter lucknowensis TaxID=1077936 RepID=A0A1N6U7R5_9BACT|nr:porin family protein [Pontibacter lucknowensis]SIQ61672.1 Outer membrane protein beta-barrel domain-containing protein [Pontibacter lucknowensis]
MKKSILLLLAFLFSVGAYAQTDYGPSAGQQNHNLFSGTGTNSGFGIKGGVNFATLRGSDKDVLGNFSGLTTFHAGVYTQFSLGNTFSIQPEALYSRKGIERNDSTFRFDYLEVPILAVFNITENVSIHFGPQVGILMSAKEEDTEVSIEPLNTFAYGVAAGAEARLSIFRLGARYNLGLEDLRKENNQGQKINQDIKHGVFQVYLGFGF